jgi:hypothetical protein
MEVPGPDKIERAAVWVWDEGWWPATVTEALFDRGERLLIVRFEHGLTAPAYRANLKPRDPELLGADKPSGAVVKHSTRARSGKSSLQRWILTVLIIGTAAWRISPAALAQESVPISLSLEEPRLRNVISMTDRPDVPPYGWFQLSGDRTSNRSDNTIARQHVQAIPTRASEATRKSSDLASLKGYRLLDGKWQLASNDSCTSESSHAPRPLFELEFNGWTLPVMLSGRAISR